MQDHAASGSGGSCRPDAPLEPAVSPARCAISPADRARSEYICGRRYFSMSNDAGASNRFSSRLAAGCGPPGTEARGPAADSADQVPLAVLDQAAGRTSRSSSRRGWRVVLHAHLAPLLDRLLQQRHARWTRAARADLHCRRAVRQSDRARPAAAPSSSVKLPGRLQSAMRQRNVRNARFRLSASSNVRFTGRLKCSANER